MTPTVTVISVLATILSLAGNYLIAKKSIIVFPVWITSNVLWIIVNILSTFNPSMVAMYVIYCVMQTYSWYEWKKTEE